MKFPQLPKDQFIKIGSVNTRYWSIGTKGTNLILVHGLGGYAENWMFNIEALAKHFHVYVLDLIGFGKSDKPNPSNSYDDFAMFINEFMKKMKIEKASMIGNSLGGGIILHYALQFPKKLNKLILVCSSCLGKEISILFRIASIPIIGEILTRPSRRGMYKFYKEIVYDKSLVTDEFIELGYQMSSLPGAQRSYLKTTRANVNFFGSKSKIIDHIRINLHKITAPTLIIWGNQDKILPVSHAHIAEKSIPNSTLHIFEKCGHVPMIEYVDDFNSIAIKFMSS
ncbi:MAG: alpha/beta fold hydrolase [Cyclobacteriaceae bacterium]|nr:alpha/beta fold hydrolase [Cyclobacteriaceae bacterium]MCK5470867.1 alpha/beta fold hydrolase [Cyclobacteriaceae bacterium]